MPNLITDLFEYDTKSIVDFLVYPAGLKDGAVDHAVHIPMGHIVGGPASIYLQTTQFENGLTNISILEQLHPTAATDIAAGLRHAAATAVIDLSLEEIVHESTGGFIKAEVERVGKPIAERMLSLIPQVVEDVRAQNQVDELMEDFDREFGEHPEGNSSN